MISVLDKKFVPSISSKDIQQAVSSVADAINRDYEGREVVFVIVLTGAFMFAADLIRRIHLKCKVTCVKISSYEGMQSTGKINSVMGLTEDVAGKDVVVIEDIVDTGRTMHYFTQYLREQNAKSVEVCSFLFKPNAILDKADTPKYVGIRIPNLFIVGYGLDYDGYARNLDSIYTISES